MVKEEKGELQVGSVLVVGHEYRVVVATNLECATPSVTVIILGTEGYNTGGNSGNVPYRMSLPLKYASIVSKKEAQQKFTERWRKVTDLFPDIDK